MISHAILTYNKGRTSGLADGIVITPSHNPPEDGGFKYNPPHGGPADTDVTSWIERAANASSRPNLGCGGSLMSGPEHQPASIVMISSRPTLPIWRMWSTWMRSALRGQTRHRPAGWRERPFLAADHRALRYRGDDRQRYDRPDVSVHDGRLGR